MNGIFLATMLVDDDAPPERVSVYMEGETRTFFFSLGVISHYYASSHGSYGTSERKIRFRIFYRHESLCLRSNNLIYHEGGNQQWH
jgi:hypothetical protein